MLLTISTTHTPATDLGFLVHKHPERIFRDGLAFGEVRIFFAEATETKATMVLAVDVPPVGLVRRGRGDMIGFDLDQYVNDRPYAASSFLSVAISQCLGSALQGRSRERPELVNQPLPLEVRLPVVPCRGGEPVLRRLFEPLGYTVEATFAPLDEHFPEWGTSRYAALSLRASCRLQDLLAHLYVLLPVLDDDKHYWVDEREIEKLLRHGASWLAAHPEREFITTRYLRYRKTLTRQALSRLLAEAEEAPAEEAAEGEVPEVERRRGQLHEQRLDTALTVVRESGARSVLDVGCGEGRFLVLAQREKGIERLVGMDVSSLALERAAERLGRGKTRQRGGPSVTLLHGSVSYRDERLSGFDAAVVLEVVEHLENHQLERFTKNLFAAARPAVVVLTTPNREYNVRYEQLAAGALRHRDHRFEWTRAEFSAWAEATAASAGYTVAVSGVGEADAEVGAPSQLAVFRRLGAVG